MKKVKLWVIPALISTLGISGFMIYNKIKAPASVVSFNAPVQRSSPLVGGISNETKSSGREKPKIKANDDDFASIEKDFPGAFDRNNSFSTDLENARALLLVPLRSAQQAEQLKSVLNSPKTALAIQNLYREKLEVSYVAQRENQRFKSLDVLLAMVELSSHSNGLSSLPEDDLSAAIKSAVLAILDIRVTQIQNIHVARSYAGDIIKLLNGIKIHNPKYFALCSRKLKKENRHANILKYLDERGVSDM